MLAHIVHFVTVVIHRIGGLENKDGFLMGWITVIHRIGGLESSRV